MIPNRSALFALAALALPAGAQAQQVSADILIGGGPVAGRIIVGDPYYHRPHYHPVYREVIVVRGHRGHGWYKNHGYRPVRVYYDYRRDRFYDRAYYGGLRAVVVYRDGGRYFHEGDWRRDYRRDDYRRDDYRRDDYGRDEYRNDYRRRGGDRSDRWDRDRD